MFKIILKIIHLNISCSQLMENILDEELSFNDRLNNLEKLYENNSELCLECINLLTTSYLLQSTSIMENFLSLICTSQKLDIITLNQIANCVYIENKSKSYSLFYSIITKHEKGQISIFIDIYKILFEVENYPDIILLFNKNILDNSSIDEQYKLRVINNLKNNENILKKYIKNMYEHVLIHFSDRSKIIAAQYLIDKIDTFEILLNIAKNNENYNIRADACDLILHSKNEKYITLATEILKSLSVDKGKFNTIYNNKQNVHTLDDSVNDIINKMSSIKISSLTIDDIERELLTICNEKDINKLKNSLFRIKIDNMLYNNCSLTNILNRVYTIINNHEHKSTLLNRLVEELIDMESTCSSGHCTRLLNVLHGFGYELNIGFKEQLRSNLFAKLNVYIKNIPNMKLQINGKELNEEQLLQLQENILNELAEDTDIINKMNLKIFFRECIGKIRDELYIEFKEYINDNDFEEYIREAIIEFEKN